MGGRITVGGLRWTLQFLADDAEVFFGADEPKFSIGQMVKVLNRHPESDYVSRSDSEVLAVLPNGLYRVTETRSYSSQSIGTITSLGDKLVHESELEPA